MIQEKYTIVWAPNDRTIGKRECSILLKNVFGPCLNKLTSLMKQNRTIVTYSEKDKYSVFGP